MKYKDLRKEPVPPETETYYKASLNKPPAYEWKDQAMEQNRSPEIDLSSYGNVVYDKTDISKLWDKNRLLSTWYWDN